MLKEIELNNFLSYKKEKVSFSDNSTIAVVGDNGNGKSGLLESILFCLYGEGRDDLQKLVRIGSNGEMSVKVVITDVPVKGKSLIVERGTKKSGAGYLRVYIDSDLMTSGGAKGSGSTAQEYINEILGMDYNSFLLTSFFGLGSNDSLMQVAPSVRLETLQKLAGVDICMEFNKKASEYAKELSNKINTAQSVVNALSESNDNIDDLTKELAERSGELKACKSKLDATQTERTELSKQETKYQNLLREIELVRVNRDGKVSQKEREDRNLVTAMRELKTLKAEASDLMGKKRSLESELSMLGNKADAVNEYNKLNDLIAHDEAMFSMRETASQMSSDSVAVCPLCGSEITAECKQHWSMELEQLSAKLTENKEKRVEYKDRVEYFSVAERKLEKLAVSMSHNVKSISDTETDLKDTEKELSVLKSNLDALDTRLVAIKTSLKEFDSTVNAIKELDETLNRLHRKQGECTQAVSDVRKRIQTCNTESGKIEAMKNEISQDTGKMLSYRVVADAFSRYAIPIALLRNLRTSLEKRATRILQYFKSGVIRIDDVAGAKPGVEFVLYDEIGARSYKALSTGEKIMVFLSVRVALSQLLNANNNNKIDFLILDEVTGNLSPNKRDALTKLINTLLRKYFTQVFMVSHVELRDIFNETIFIDKVAGVSEIRVMQ